MRGLSKLASRINDQLRRNRDRGMIDLESALTISGRAFTLSTRFGDDGENISNGDSIYFYLDNPEGSGYDYGLVFIPRSDGLSDIDISRGGVTEVTPGEHVEPFNKRESSGREFSGIARKTTTVRDGEYEHADGPHYVDDVIPGSGVGEPNVAGQQIDSFSMSIQEGSDLLFELTNQSGGNLDRMVVNTVVYELSADIIASTVKPNPGDSQKFIRE